MGKRERIKDKAGHDINYVALSGIAGHSGRQHSGTTTNGDSNADVAGGSLHSVIGILAAVIEQATEWFGAVY